MTLTDEQRGLRDAVRTLVTKQSDPAAVRRAVDLPSGYDQQLWHVLTEQIGVPALAVPERFGGAGAGAAEIAIVQDELGRTLTPSPMLGSAVLGVQLLLALGDDAACERLLPRLAEGAVASVAWAGRDGRWEPDAGALAAEGNRLSGEAHYVLDGDHADIILAVAGAAVYEIDPSAAQRSHTPTMDRTRRLASVRLDDVPGTRIGADGDPEALATARDQAIVALAAEQVGAAAAALAATIEYTKVRHQFGRPIGSFQALKHRMADLHVLLESARSAVAAAVEGTVSASVAKVYCTEAFQTIAAEAIQLHGGIAITWEHDAQLYFKRAHGSALLFGSPTDHLRRIGEDLS
jgi:alkylation response protein AidB-like acyl-CoA dehydrogenase